MKRIPIFGLLLLLTGCIIHTAPLSDPFKGKPDKRLIGKWKDEKGKVFTIRPVEEAWVKKGVPAGFMLFSGPDPETSCFYCSRVGKDHYATAIGLAPAKDLTAEKVLANLEMVGKKEVTFGSVRYTVDDDTLRIFEVDQKKAKKAGLKVGKFGLNIDGTTAEVRRLLIKHRDAIFGEPQVLTRVKE